MNLTEEHEVVSLVVRYGFDLGDYQAAALVRFWSGKFDKSWLLPATIEALNRGRYKVASIEQVLNSWQRQGYMTVRFAPEFAEMVLGHSYQPLNQIEDQEAIEESLLDLEIHQFSEQDLDEAHQFVDEIGLSQPALDEDAGAWGKANTQILREQVPFKSGVVSDLTASSYPPAKIRKPGEEEFAPSQVPPQLPLPDTFEPPSEVSQFYYRLLQMANTSPVANKDNYIPNTESERQAGS